ncbi:Glucose-6-phosphate 1-dehydrogenase [uncultured archaeon]|nr:Glucose-6-phosphate 1-dehydrogenase [uncultured archaeon]
MSKLFIFGSTGDLVKRKVLPALHHVRGLEVYAIGRKQMEHEDYHEVYCPECENIFLKRLKYIQIDFSSIVESIKPYLEKDEVNYFYVSLPPDMIRGILESLSYLKEYKIKILVEKPFGSNLKEAELLFDFIKENNLEENVFLADHYIFKKNVLSLESSDYSNVKLVSLEKLGLEKRGYYDSVGALRDMVQSHFLNILFRLVPNIDLNNFKILDFKLGQYEEYVSELGDESKTETYVKLRVAFENLEVEFVTGKGFDKKESFLVLGKNSLDFGDDNSYVAMFHDFLNGDKKVFPTIENAIKSWKFIENVEQNKPSLDYYKKGSSASNFM